MGSDVAVFEAVHGTAPDIAGTNAANPTALLMSSLLMLRHLELDAMADAIMAALTAVLSRGQATTRDLGGKASTTEFADAICREMDAGGRTA
jgi:isocitrate dehydrogenase (NAD+)